MLLTLAEMINILWAYLSFFLAPSINFLAETQKARQETSMFERENPACFYLAWGKQEVHFGPELGSRKTRKK